MNIRPLDKEELLVDCWMWNLKFNTFIDGTRQLQTVKAATVKEAATMYFINKYVPIQKIDEAFLRRMENNLRLFYGGEINGLEIPQDEFLQMPAPFPDGVLMPNASLEGKEPVSNDIDAEKINDMQETERKKQLKESGGIANVTSN